MSKNPQNEVHNASSANNSGKTNEEKESKAKEVKRQEARKSELELIRIADSWSTERRAPCAALTTQGDMDYKDAQIALLEAGARRKDHTMAMLLGVIDAYILDRGESSKDIAISRIRGAAIGKHIHDLKGDSKLTKTDKERQIYDLAGEISSDVEKYAKKLKE